MNFLRKISIKNKLIAVILIVTSIATTVGMVVHLLTDISIFKEEMVRGTILNARLIGDYCITPLAFDDKLGAEEILQKLTAVPDIQRGFVYDSNHTLFASYESNDSLKFDPPIRTIKIDDSIRSDSYYIFRKDHLHVYQTIEYDDIEYGSIALFASTKRLNEEIHSHLITMFGLTIAIIVFTYLLAVWMQGLISNPILRLAGATQRISSERDYSIRVEKFGDDEIGALYESFNEMLKQIHIREIQRDEAEAALRENEQRLTLALQGANQGLYDLNIKTGDAVVSPEYALMLGYEPHEFQETNEKWILRLHPDDMERTKQVFTSYIQGETEIYAVEFRQKTKSGTWKWILSLGKIVERDEEGNPLRMVGTHTDITASKLAEEQIRSLNEDLEQRVRERTAKLEAANQELESFAYSISHDLRTPLRGINGFSQALVDDYYDIIDKNGKDYLFRIQRASKRLGTLIDDLLSLSRITRYEMKKVKVDLSKMTEEIFNDYKTFDPDRNVKTDIKSGLVVEGDTHLLRTMMQNFIENAMKFTNKRQIAEIRFGAIEENGNMVYFIKDNGAGFEMAYVHKLFIPFQRLHSESEFEGTGIGLATVRRIVNQHGGRVWAEAEVDKGATFYFTISEEKT